MDGAPAGLSPDFCTLLMRGAYLIVNRSEILDYQIRQ